MKCITSILFSASIVCWGMGCQPISKGGQITQVLNATQTIVASPITHPTIMATATTSPTLKPAVTLYPFTQFWQEQACQLPCWMGFVPGKTIWQNIELPIFISDDNKNIVKRNISLIKIDYSTRITTKNIQQNIEFFTIKGIVQSMHIEIADTEYKSSDFSWDDPNDEWRRFEPGPLIVQYGKPDQTLIVADYETVRGGTWLLGGLFLIFEKQSFIVQYSFRMNLYTQQFCPTFSHPVTPGYDVEYYDPTSLIPGFDIYMTAGKLKSDLYELLPVKSFTSAGFTLFEERTGITNWETLLLENPSHCFIIPPEPPTLGATH